MKSFLLILLFPCLVLATFGFGSDHLFGNPLALSSLDGVNSSDAPVFASEVALNFNGTDESVDLGNDASMQLSNDFTMSIWIKSSTSGATDCFFAKMNNGTDEGIEMYFSGAGNLRNYISEDGDFIPSKNYQYSGTGNDGAWHHVAITFSSGGVLLLYVDGSEDTSVVKLTDNAVANVNNTTAQMQLGACETGGTPGNFYEGLIDDPAIFSKVLDSDAIAEVFGTGVPNDLRLHSDAANLIGYWIFDGDSTSNIADQSTNSNDGTPVNIDADDFSSDVPL